MFQNLYFTQLSSLCEYKYFRRTCIYRGMSYLKPNENAPCSTRKLLISGFLSYCWWISSSTVGGTNICNNNKVVIVSLLNLVNTFVSHFIT